MEGEPDPPKAPLAYAEPDPRPRVRWIDIVGHLLFGVGVALILGGYCGKDYRYSGLIGDVLMEYWPHIMMAGGFLCGALLSVRIGRFPL